MQCLRRGHLPTLSLPTAALGIFACQMMFNAAAVGGQTLYPATLPDNPTHVLKKKTSVKGGGWMQPYLEHAAETWPKLGNVAFQTATAKTMPSVHCTKTLLVEPMFPLREVTGEQ